MANTIQNFIEQQIIDSYSTKQKILTDQNLLDQLEEIASMCLASLNQGGKVMLAGNGGSAADAQHIAAEFVNYLNFDRPALSSVALTTDTSVLTSIGNDSSYEQVFARQIAANGRSGDVFIGISTSGNSRNVVNALQQARQQNITTVGFLGGNGGQMKELCDYYLLAPSAFTPRIQECHILFGHIICDIVEQTLFAEKPDWD